MEKNYEKREYQDMVKEKLIPEYIEGADLSQIEWVNLDAKQLHDFLTENYTYDVDGERQFIGNIDESKFNNCDNSPLGIQYLSYQDSVHFYGTIRNDDNNYLIGVANNSAGKKTIVAALTYQSQSKSVYYNQTLPVTKISIAEVNSFFEQPDIYKQMMENFVDIADKENNIVMILTTECLDEAEIKKEQNTFALLQQAAIDKEFPMAVLLADFENDTELRQILCSNEDIPQKH